jgi:prepilin-type N-terminal cleavage/methylation domain-containing protein
MKNEIADSLQSSVHSRRPMVHRLSTMDQSGFTFIEILITISVIAILFVPIMQLFSHSVFATGYNVDQITATNLAKSEMERVINLNLSKAQMLKVGDQIFPPEKEKALEVNGSLWRVRREIVPGTNPLEVRVHAYKDGHPEKSEATLVTLIEDMMWESVKTLPGSAEEA